MNKERAEKLYKVVKELQPNIIMNNRLGGGLPRRHGNARAAHPGRRASRTATGKPA